MGDLDPIDFSFLTPFDWELFQIFTTAPLGVEPGGLVSVILEQSSTVLLRSSLEHFGQMIQELAQRNIPTRRVGSLMVALMVELASRGEDVGDLGIGPQCILL